MRAPIFAVLTACVLATAACKQMSVRGPEGQEVTATTPMSLTIRRGSTEPLQVAIDRENFHGPVTVTIAQLPKGVSADRSSMTVDTTSATFALKASTTADLVSNQAVSVTIAAMDGRKAMQYVSLTVVD